MKMNNIELVQKLHDIIKNNKTVYMWGVFGSPVTEALIVAKSKQYPSWYTASKQAALRKLIGKGYFGFDCVNLIKGILWGWNGDSTKSNGGAVYNSNNVPDLSANMMIDKCIGVSTNFANIEVGEAVWMPGHIGVYIGDGKVIECTPSWSNNVQITACLNINSIQGLNGRRWIKHGKIPYITYVKENVPEYIKILRSKVDSPDGWIKFIEDNKNDKMGKWLPDLIVKLSK